MKRRLTRSKKRLVRNSLIVTNAVLLLFVAGFVISTRSSQLSQPEGPALFTTSDENVADPLDTLSSADIAVSIAQLVQLDEATAVTNNADSINTQFEIVPADAQIVAKPQIVTTDVLSASDVETYVAVDGDTISSIAEKFGVSQNSIRWSNDLSGSNVAAGTELSIPPLDGFIYDVEDGDTVEKLAERYSAEADRITAFNDIELVGLVAGQQQPLGQVMDAGAGVARHDRQRVEQQRHRCFDGPDAAQAAGIGGDIGRATVQHAPAVAAPARLFLPTLRHVEQPPDDVDAVGVAGIADQGEPALCMKRLPGLIPRPDISA